MCLHHYIIISRIIAFPATVNPSLLCGPPMSRPSRIQVQRSCACGLQRQQHSIVSIVSSQKKKIEPGFTVPFLFQSSIPQFANVFFSVTIMKGFPDKIFGTFQLVFRHEDFTATTFEGSAPRGNGRARCRATCIARMPCAGGAGRVKDHHFQGDDLVVIVLCFRRFLFNFHKPIRTLGDKNHLLFWGVT